MIAPSPTAYLQMPPRARAEARKGVALWPEAAVAGVAWARWNRHRFDRAATLALLGFGVLLVALRFVSDEFALERVGEALVWVTMLLGIQREASLVRMEARLTSSAAGALIDAGGPLEMRRLRTARRRGWEAALVAACILGVLAPAWYGFVAAATGAALIAAPYHRGDVAVRLDEHGITVPALRTTMPWPLVTGGKIRGEQLIWTVAAGAESCSPSWWARMVIKRRGLRIPLMAVAGGAEYAWLVSDRYMSTVGPRIPQPRASVAG